MQTDIKEAGPFERILTIRLEEQELESAKNKAARKLSKSMRIKGFRPGKAPRSIVERMVGAATLRNEAIDDSLPELVGPAIDEAELQPATPPRVEAVRDAQDGGVDVDIKVTLWPVLDAVPDFSGRKITVESPVVTDEEITSQIDRLRDQYAELEDVARPADTGDFVMINISAAVEGQDVPEATADDLLYEVGSHSFIPGLDDILGGASIGDIREGPGTLPPGFGEDEAREATLKVLVKGVRAKRLPEVTDEWVSDVSEFDSIEELTNRIRTNLSIMKLDAADRVFRDRLLDEISSELGFEMPEALIDAELEAAFHNLAHTLEQQGLDFANYLRITGQSEQQFVDELKSRSERTLRTRILLDSVVAIDGLELADGELDQAIASMAEDANQDAVTLKESLVASGRVDVLTSDILRRKALDRIVDSAEAIDDEGEHIDLRPPAIADDTDDSAAEDDELVTQEDTEEE